MHFEIRQSFRAGHLDRIQVDPSGIVRLTGWHNGPLEPSELPTISIDGQSIPFLQLFRFDRSDVRASLSSQSNQLGLTIEYLVPPGFPASARTVVVQIPKMGALSFEGPLQFIEPHYRSLLNSPEVLHREHIYGSGPPNPSVHPDVAALALSLPGPVLDFGCGAGVLVRILRQHGVEAYGLELDTPVIRQHTLPEVASFVTLYDGTFPTPFPAGAFESVFCSEVLEHIPDYRGALADVSRIVRRNAAFTVPDAAAIPLNFRHGVVPWHLLEGTHVNFFNQQSLSHSLAPFFNQIEWGRIGRVSVNDAEFYVSLSAFCSKSESR